MLILMLWILNIYMNTFFFNQTGTLRDTLKSLHVNFTQASKISDIVLCDFVHKEVTDDDNENLVCVETFLYVFSF